MGEGGGGGGGAYEGHDQLREQLPSWMSGRARVCTPVETPGHELHRL